MKILDFLNSSIINLVVTHKNSPTWLPWMKKHWKKFIALYVSRLDSFDWSKNWRYWTFFKGFKITLTVNWWHEGKPVTKSNPKICPKLYNHKTFFYKGLFFTVFYMIWVWLKILRKIDIDVLKTPLPTYLTVSGHIKTMWETVIYKEKNPCLFSSWALIEKLTVL